jgi:hypothetical protein
MISLLPVSDDDINKRLTEINFRLTEHRKIFFFQCAALGGGNFMEAIGVIIFQRSSALLLL